MVTIVQRKCLCCGDKVDPDIKYCDTCLEDDPLSESDWYTAEFREWRFNNGPPPVKPCYETSDAEENRMGGIRWFCRLTETVTQELLDWLHDYNYSVYLDIKDWGTEQEAIGQRVRLEWSCYYDSSPGDGECIDWLAGDLYGLFADRAIACEKAKSSDITQVIKFFERRQLFATVLSNICAVALWPRSIIDLLNEIYRFRLKDWDKNYRVGYLNYPVEESDSTKTYRKWAQEHRANNDLYWAKQYESRVERDLEREREYARQYVKKAWEPIPEFWLVMRNRSRYNFVRWCEKNKLKWLSAWYYGYEGWFEDEEVKYQDLLNKTAKITHYQGYEEEDLHEWMNNNDEKFPCNCDACTFDNDKEVWLDGMIGCADFCNWDWECEFYSFEE